MVTKCSEVTDSGDLDGWIFIAINIGRIFQVIMIILILIGSIIVFGCRKSQDRPRLVNILHILALSCAAALLYELIIFILINKFEKDPTSSD